VTLNFGRENRGSIPSSCNRKRQELLDAPNQIKPVMKEKQKQKKKPEIPVYDYQLLLR
jgi:hypothetical protein